MSNAGASQTILPKPYVSRVLEPAIAQAASSRLVERIWAKDASLWTSDPAAQQHIGRRLGWLTILDVMAQRADEVIAFAQEIRQAGFTHALLLGMGGSSLFSEVCRFTFGTADGWLDLTVMDTTDPTAIQAAQQRVPMQKTLFIVSSKSGSTTESSALCDYFYDQIRQIKNDNKAGEQFIAITDAGTSLEALAKERRFRRAFVHGPGTGQEVGGRFSGVTYFGMVPAALQGVDVKQLISRGQQMLKACGATVPAVENPALALGLLLAESAKLGRDKMTLLSAGSLGKFGVWVEQLIAESVGKSGKGIIPVDNEPPKSPTAYPKDRVFIELQLANELDAKHAEALIEQGHPVVRLHLKDRYDLGAEVMRWFLATATCAAAMGVNAFDEPNVQESKDRTKALLERYVKEGSLPVGQPLFNDQGISVFGQPPAVSGDSVESALRRLIKQAKLGDYLAICSFLPRTVALDRTVQALHRALSERLEIAVTLGFGPRYLHSTGQLHKGGPDKVLLLFLTSEDLVDLPIPGKPYGFGILKQAQALGDLQALQERKRRVIRLHLGNAPERGMDRLRSIVDQIVRLAAAKLTR